MLDTAPHDQETFCAFIDAYYDKIFGYAWRILGHREDAEDLAQEICISLPAKLSSFRGDSRITTWLYRIVTNAAIDKMRKRDRWRASAPDWAEQLEQDALAGRERTEAHLWLIRSFSNLPEELRITAALMVEQDMTQAEMAKCLDVAPGTISWRISEIKRRLREMMEEERNAE